MPLKQWRVPSTLNLFCLLTKSCKFFNEVAIVTRSVPYVTLPAQFLSFSPMRQASNGESKGVLSAAEQSFRKVLLSIDVTQANRHYEYSGGSARLWVNSFLARFRIDSSLPKCARSSNERKHAYLLTLLRPRCTNSEPAHSLFQGNSSFTAGVAISPYIQSGLWTNDGINHYSSSFDGRGADDYDS